jgi:HK97 family phage major capsid protein
MNEKIAALQAKLTGMKAMIPGGGSSDEQIAHYFTSQEEIIEDVIRTLGDIHEASTSETESIKDAVKAIRDSLKAASSTINVLSRREIEYQIGKALAGAWTNNRQLIGEAKCCPNLRTEKWNNPKDFSWTAEKGFTATKDVLGTPMGDMATNEQYLINPVYEDTILTDVAKKSVMMGLVTTRPMTGPSLFIPEHDRGGVVLHWLTGIGQKIEGSKPNGAVRKELKAYTLAGYIPWFDEFDEDVFVELGKIFIEEFSDCYATEFDKQCLTADAAPFTGVMSVKETESYTLGSADVTKLDYTDFRNAELRVLPEERRDCKWFFHETILNHVANIKDNNGYPIWRKPGDGKPGNVDGYDYYESSLLPQLADIKANAPFVIFMNPKRIIHGNRNGIEIKRFDATTESLEYGENFMRFRKRSGFMVSRPKGNIVVMKTKAV